MTAPVATKTSPATKWLAAIDAAFRGSPPRAPEAINAVLNAAPVIPLLSPNGYQFADISLYMVRSRTGDILQRVIKTCDVKGALVERSHWDEHIIRFPWYFPEELIRLSFDDDKLWSLWANGHQWVNSGFCLEIMTTRSSLLWAKGPAAAGGKWTTWWETADCCTWPNRGDVEEVE